MVAKGFVFARGVPVDEIVSLCVIPFHLKYLCAFFNRNVKLVSVEICFAVHFNSAKVSLCFVTANGEQRVVTVSFAVESVFFFDNLATDILNENPDA